MKEVLLHCCCAPCSAAIIEWMLANETRPTLYYCNPNIYPEAEYLKRKAELTRHAEGLGLRVLDDETGGGWTGWETYHAGWLRDVSGLETEPERGRRCLVCFRHRLLRAARVAAREGIGTFTTTLASSRWKSLAQITQAGQWAADTVNAENAATEGAPRVTFDARNWRKGGLQERRAALLRECGFYNQLYCGCEYSMPQTT